MAKLEDAARRWRMHAPALRARVTTALGKKEVELVGILRGSSGMTGEMPDSQVSAENYLAVIRAARDLLEEAGLP